MPDSLPIITTSRLLIRRFTAADWQDLYEYLSDPAVVFFEPYEAYTQDACQQEAVRRAADVRFWAVALKHSGKVIGNITLTRQDFDTWELGYVFNARYQGHGYAAESAAAVVENAILHLHARRIIAMCDPKNEKSWKLLERLHMRREGHLHQNVYFKTDGNGQPLWKDTYLYGILASQWQTPDCPAPIVAIDERNIALAAEIRSASWQESHRSFCSREFVERHTPAQQVDYLRGRLQAGKTLYMLTEPKPVGIVSVCENLIEDLYIAPEEQHKGYGTKLLLFAMEQCTGTPTLWVLSNNQKACSLYTKYGFQKTGS